MNQPLLTESKIININYENYWKKTLLYKISFGKAKPGESWKRQLERIHKRKYENLFSNI
jgi:hypothetical protein